MRARPCAHGGQKCRNTEQQKKKKEKNVVDRARRQVERRVREAFHIYKRQPKINRESGLERSAVWNAVL